MYIDRQWRAGYGCLALPPAVLWSVGLEGQNLPVDGNPASFEVQTGTLWMRRHSLMVSADLVTGLAPANR